MKYLLGVALLLTVLAGVALAVGGVRLPPCPQVSEDGDPLPPGSKATYTWSVYWGGHEFEEGYLRTLWDETTQIVWVMGWPFEIHTIEWRCNDGFNRTLIWDETDGHYFYLDEDLRVEVTMTPNGLWVEAFIDLPGGGLPPVFTHISGGLHKQFHR